MWFSNLFSNNKPIVFKYISETVAFYDAHLREVYGVPKGCKLRQIEVFEKRLGIHLPMAYREFLLWMGEDFGGIFRGTLIFFRDLKVNEEILLEMSEQYSLPVDAPSVMVFFTHQGYQACWFKLCDDSQDPICFYFNNSQLSVGVRDIGSFTKFLDIQVRGLSGIK